jgi:hypothetical protein
MDEPIKETVTVQLKGADLELVRAGQAQGQAAGLRSAADLIEQAMEEWRKQVVKQYPKRKKEVKEFVESFATTLAPLRKQADALDVEGRQALGRAASLGAGQPRERGLRRQVGGAIMGLGRKLKGD